MKNLYKTLSLTAMMLGSISLHAHPLLGRFAASAAPIALGATAGYQLTNEVSRTIKNKDYGATAEITALATTGTAITGLSGTFFSIYAQIMNACTPRPVEPGSINAQVQSANRVLFLFGNSMRLGTRSMIAGSLATLAYPSIQRAYNARFHSDK